MQLLRNILFKIRFIFLSNSVYYINSSAALPPPLTKAEEAVIMQQIRDGDEKAREPLIVHNLRLVVYIAKKFENSNVNIEDLISIGTIGLIKAVNTFSPDRNIKLATYASRCIENEILMFIRKTGNLRAELSIDEPLSTDYDGNELVLSDVLGTDEDGAMRELEENEEISQLLEAVSRLNTREATIMELRFGLNGNKEHTQKEVADLLGISQSYISRLEKRSIGKLKQELEKVM